MENRSLEGRLVLLENELRGLPERVGALEGRVGWLTVEFVQFRGEVRSESSATRAELRQEIRDSLGALHEKIDTVDQKLDGLDQKVDRLDQRVDGLDQKVDGLKIDLHTLHDRAMEEMHALHLVAMSGTRALFEDAIQRLKIIREG